MSRLEKVVLTIALAIIATFAGHIVTYYLTYLNQ